MDLISLSTGPLPCDLLLSQRNLSMLQHTFNPCSRSSHQRPTMYVSRVLPCLEQLLGHWTAIVSTRLGVARRVESALAQGRLTVARFLLLRRTLASARSYPINRTSLTVKRPIPDTRPPCSRESGTELRLERLCVRSQQPLLAARLTPPSQVRSVEAVL